MSFCLFGCCCFLLLLVWLLEWVRNEKNKINFKKDSNTDSVSFYMLNNCRMHNSYYCGLSGISLKFPDKHTINASTEHIQIISYNMTQWNIADKYWSGSGPHGQILLTVDHFRSSACAAGSPPTDRRRSAFAEP